MAIEIFQGMKFFRRYNDPQKDGFSLKIRLTNRCNQSCHYCFYRDNTSAFADLDKVYRFIAAMTEKHDYFYIYLHGGEPTLHPDFLTFVASLNVLFKMKEKDYFLYFDTNFTQSTSFWNEFMSSTDVLKTKVNCTVHPSQCNPSGRHRFLQMFEDLTTIKQLNIMVEYDTFDECKKIFYSLNPDWNVVPKPIFFNGNELKYSEEQKKFFYDNDKTRQFYYVDGEGEYIFTLNQIDIEGLNDFSFLQCEYGQKNVVIDVNGNMYYCVAHQLSNGNPFMNLYKDGIDRYFEVAKPNICLFKKCSACDLRILKVKKI